MYPFRAYCYCLGLILGLQGVPECCAQALAPIPRFETIGVDNGLSQSSVYAIYQDKQGFLWVGTGDGLNRYDGLEVRQYRVPSASGQAPSSHVAGALCEDDSGNIWFSNHRGIHCWNSWHQKILSYYSFDPRTFKGNGYTAVGLLQGRMLWSFGYGIGLYCYDIMLKRGQFYPLPASYYRPAEQPLPIHPTIDNNGRIWFKSYANEAFHCFDTKTGQYSSPLKDTSYRRIFFARGRHLIIATSSFHIYDSAQRKTTTIPAASLNGYRLGSYSLLEDRWGRIWISTSGDGLFCFDPSNPGLFRQYTHSNVKLRSLPIDLLTTLYIDRAHNLWIGTDGGGVCRLDLKPPRFNLFPLNEGDYPMLKDYFIKCFYEDEEGLLWFGTHTNGLCAFDLHSGELQHYPANEVASNRLPNNIVGVIERADDRQMWIGHALGFSLFDRQQGTFEQVEIKPRPTYNKWNVFGTGMCRLKDGRFLASTTSGLVQFANDGKNWTGRCFVHNKELCTNTTSVCQMVDGSIWLSTTTKGLYQLEASGDSFLIRRKFFEGLNVRGLCPDVSNSQLLWVCSSNGLFELNTRSGTYKVYGTEQGLNNAYIYGLLQRADANLWLSTNGGLSFFDRKARRFVNYTVVDGLQSNEFNSGAHHKGRSGLFYFGGIKGFNWFNPSDGPSINAMVAPGLAVLRVSVNERQLTREDPMFSSNTLDLPYNSNNLSFSFAALDYTRPQANRIAYWLEGWDPTWILTESRSAHYSNLPPGHYTLRLKAVNGYGTWSEEQRWHIRIAAPFWRTPLFLICVATMLACMLIGIVVIIIRSRVNARMRVYERQQALMEERSRISKDMHDEIGSGLTRIAMMSEGLRLQGQRIRTEEPQKISSAARGLVQNISEIIWALNPNHDTLESLLAYMREQINEFVEPFAIDCQIDFPEHVPHYTLTNVERRNLYLSTKEAVNNVLKHSGASKVNIAVGISQSLLIEVSDDGKGIIKEQIRSSSNGLYNMQKRIEEIGGTYHCASMPGSTSVRFDLPLRVSSSSRANKRTTTFFTLARKRSS